MVIPPKRNMFGKRFGFARFKEVGDERVFAVKLDNVVIDIRKIHASFPRFTRSSSGYQKDGVEVTRTKCSEKVNEAKQVSRNVGWGSKRGIKSFIEVVKNKEHQSLEKVCLFSYESNKENMARMKRAFIGVVHEARMAYNIQTSFKVEGYFAIKVSPLGANLCLLEESEEGVISDLINEGRIWWNQ